MGCQQFRQVTWKLVLEVSGLYTHGRQWRGRDCMKKIDASHESEEMDTPVYISLSLS